MFFLSVLNIQDTRPAEEYEVSHIPGAIRVDHSRGAEEILSGIPDLNSTGEIFVYTVKSCSLVTKG